VNVVVLAVESELKQSEDQMFTIVIKFMKTIFKIVNIYNLLTYLIEEQATNEVTSHQ
jgi:hypothetical protein